MDWFDDVRIWGAAIVIIGGLLGWYLPAVPLGALTVVVLAVVYIFLQRDHGPAEGGYGVFVLTLGATVCLITPMWLAWLVKLAI